MLLTDGNPNTSEELRAYESAILSVAKAEMIDLDVKRALATEEISQEVLDFLLNRASGTDPSGNGRREAGVSDVVVSGQMKRWHALHTLTLFYRDAFHNQLNDRYQAQFLEYREAARRAKQQTLEFGVGLVNAPIPKVGKVDLTTTAGMLPEATYYIRVAWTNAAGQEGAPSELTSIVVPEGEAPVVSASDFPAVASGFAVYMGLTADAVYLQGAAALGGSYTLPESGVVPGAPAGAGQIPDVYLTGAPIMRRG